MQMLNLPENKKPRLRPAQRREYLREQLWPGAGTLVWSRKVSVGFTTIPRLLPLMMLLIKILCKKGNPSGVYFDLWARCFDEGIVAITDDNACAYSAGYTGTRAMRTWREHIWHLETLGFIRIKGQGNREIAHILLLNPLQVCADLRKKGKVPPEWWNAFIARAQEIGAEIPGTKLETQGASGK